MNLSDKFKERLCLLKGDMRNIKGRIQLIEFEEDVKQFIKELKESLILSRNKYGLDWCDQLWMKHIDKLAGDELILEREQKDLKEQ